MKRALSFLLPHAVLIPGGFVVGLVAGIVGKMGGLAAAIAGAGNTPLGPGPAHVDGSFLVVLAAVATILVLAVVSSVTIAGITAGIMGAMYGFVLSCLVDWVRFFRRKIPPRDIENVKRWAGRGAAAATVFCVWISFFNPLHDVAGIFAVTGTLVCLAFGGFGALRLAWARRR